MTRTAFAIALMCAGCTGRIDLTGTWEGTFWHESGDQVRVSAQVLEESERRYASGDWIVLDARFEVDGWPPSTGTFGYCRQTPCKWNPWGVPRDQDSLPVFHEGAVAIQTQEPGMFQRCWSDGFAQFTILADGELTSSRELVVTGDMTLDPGPFCPETAPGVFQLEKVGR